MSENKLEIPNTEVGADFRDSINRSLKAYKQDKSKDSMNRLANTLILAAYYFQDTHAECAKEIRSVALKIREMDIDDMPTAVIYH